MDVWLVLAFIFAGLELWACWKSWSQLEFVAKPAVMICLFVWLFLRTGLQGNALWFGVGILFAMAGDVLLIFRYDRMFLFGLAVFLVAQVSYISGFKEQLLHPTAWSFILLFMIFINGARLLRRIVAAMRAKGQDALVRPVIVYGLVISLTLFAAMSTIFDPAWSTRAAFLVSAGAFLLYISDLILAWNKFVAPITNRRILTILTYYLGQIGLIAGVVSQFG